MSVRVKIPTPLRRISNGNSEVVVAAASVAECVAVLEANYPGFKERLYDESGELRRFINIYVNGDDVRFLDGLTTRLKTGDEISIVPAVAGGA